jgi:MFS family permease
MRSRLALLIALGVDNFGSGLFLPLALVYVTHDGGLPLATAGPVISLGTLAGLAAPPVAGRLTDRIGPRPLVVTAELLQALGALTYLAAHGVAAVLTAAVLLAAGQQLFYSSLFSLITDVAPEGPPDRPFAVAGMVRSACFGLGGLAVGGLLTTAGPAAYRIAVAGDAASFAACAALLAAFVRVPDRYPIMPPPGLAGLARHRLRSDRPFLALIVIAGLMALTVDFFVAGVPVFVLVRLHGPPWLPGTILALVTALMSVGGTVALRATRRLSRITTLQVAAALYVLWCLASVAAIVVPPGGRAVVLLVATVMLGCGCLLSGPRGVALAEATAPPPARGRYLAAYQYAFTIAGIVAPALVALYSVALWLPWLLVAVCAAGAIAALRELRPRLELRARAIAADKVPVTARS